MISKLNRDLINESDINKLRLLYSFTIIGVIALYSFAFIHFLNKEYSIAIFEIIAAVGGLFNILLLKLSNGKLIRLVENLMLIGMIILLIRIIIHGGVSNTAIYWIYTFPLLAFFLKGNKAGLIWNIAFMISVVLLVILNKINIVPIPYSSEEVRQALSAYIVIMVLAYVFETALFSSYEKIKKLATTDPLTGAYNRYQLFKRLEEEIERTIRYNNKLCLIMFDIDNFKKINDTYGHSVGDLVLQKVIEAVRKHLRKTDIIGRFGGEEFLIICLETDVKGGKKLAEKIRRIIEDLRTENLPEITVSIGVAGFDGYERLHDFIKKADIALYSAKRKGKNRVEIYDPQEICFHPIDKKNLVFYKKNLPLKAG
ncbi:GGDEF domain-containing protein [Persephonella sp.]